MVYIVVVIPKFYKIAFLDKWYIMGTCNFYYWFGSNVAFRMIEKTYGNSFDRYKTRTTLVGTLLRTLNQLSLDILLAHGCDIHQPLKNAVRPTFSFTSNFSIHFYLISSIIFYFPKFHYMRSHYQNNHILYASI